MERYRRWVSENAPGALREIVSNRFRRLLGKEARPSRSARLFSRHAAHLLRRRPISKLTVTEYLDGEGGGSKALMMMWAIGFCRRFGIDYVHTPFSGLRHADRPQREFDAAWEAFFNLGEGEVSASSCKGEAFDLFLLSHKKLPEGGDLTSFIQPPLPGPRPAYYLEIDSLEHEVLRSLHAQQFCEILEPCLPDFRQRFWAAKQRDDNEGLQVAVHLRRGDVGPDRDDMWTGVSEVKATLEQVTEVLGALGISATITVFSQGERDDFAELEQFTPDFVLDGDPMLTMQRLIEADLLVMAKSCFSYVAAMLNDRVILCEESAWPAFPEWIVRDGRGKFDTAALTRKLGEVTAPRP